MEAALSERADGPTTWALDISDVSAGYDGHKALEGVTFRIEPGCLAGLVGPNGAGKSTLIKIVLGMLKPWSGEVSIFGRAGKPRPGSVSYTPQVDLVDWQFPVTVSDVVLMGRYGGLGVVRRPGVRDREIAASALERVRLTAMADRQIGELSGGERRRALIARALTQQGDLMLLDEPFAGLDAAAQHDLISLFQSLVTEGKTLFIATHDLSCVDEDFDHAVLLNKHVIAFGRPADVFTTESLNEAYDRHLMVVRSGQSTYIGL
ncbi:MAG: metal ABC transporter ATP-binding protein [Chloroflexi bacterium]|nr:metal ABC transporter ATP-binding protein [Chloroflexota bacterium]MCI0782695.1 metal ABC transporter ATP-binding protein [Chloroflexota bacterium]MCI0814753.1 metal ABC transporter ATP-binding protein [Chloroflexota bacterium]MCI0818361.1 metal ABC transporter ATP-binding protein [Chloroflexota bacterium]MCI0818811.1 metal ABC transporter ATP-binding protein [Chloroflexota bacterium]